MIVFELSFPNRGSWNNKWSGDGASHIIVKKDCKALNKIIGKDFYYRWDDGWTARVSVEHYSSRENDYKQLVRNNRGFCGYNWMVESIVRCGEIKTNYEEE